MRVLREPSRAHIRSRGPLLLVSSSLLVIPAVLSASPVVAASAVVGPFGVASSPVRQAGFAGAGAGAGRPVAPTVTDTAIPAVAPRKSSVATGDLADLPRAPKGRLVAHVTRPRLPQFSMVAVTWNQMKGSASVSALVRTRDHGDWSAWTTLGVDGDGPSRAEDPNVRAGTAPLWVDHATGVEVVVYAARSRHPRKLQVDTIDPGTSTSEPSKVSGPAVAAAANQGAGPQAGTFPGIPTIVTRREWGADESLGDTCWDPKYGTTFKAAIVHHTAGSNDYSRAEGPALVRGIYAYHVISRGWCDIGYNFLIDRYGTIYEGRSGGIRQPVRGAHSGDYNLDTTGISLMGNFDSSRPTRAMKHSLVQLIAWRLGTAYHGAYGKVFLYDAKFSRISGHRDVMQTACPGRYVYAWLPTLRERVQTRLGDYASKIEAAWQAAGGKRSDLGAVRVGERGENGGHHTTFAGGRMYVSGAGLFTLYHGPILHRYAVSGETAGPLGYPASKVRTVPGTSGLAGSFTDGRIYWSDATGGRMLRRGAILKHYLDDGAATGELGFPVNEIYSITGGTRARFQHGSISYDASTHRTTVTVR